MVRPFLFIIAWLAGVVLAAPMRAEGVLGPPAVLAGTSASSLCRSAIAAMELQTRIPDQFLSAIARVESGRREAGAGALQPWPWTINAEGVGHLYASKAEAIAAVQAMQAAGIRSIDVGCMQINLLAHPTAFTGLEQAFDPQANVAYGARFLLELFGQLGSWPKAAAAYHSMQPELGADYQRRVLAEWAVPLNAPSRAPVRAIAEGNRPTSAPLPPTVGQASGTGMPISPAGLSSVHAAIGQPAAGSVGGGFVGRGLDAYRNAPIQLSSRPFRPLSNSFAPASVRQ